MRMGVVVSVAAVVEILAFGYVTFDFPVDEYLLHVIMHCIRLTMVLRNR